MKYIKRVISVLIAMEMFMSASASAVESGNTFIKSETFNSTVDFIKNTVIEIKDDIKNIERKDDKENRKDKKSEEKENWDSDDIVEMYSQGYSIGDIDMAMKLSKKMNLLPYTLLEKKGKPEYSKKELTEENTVVNEFEETRKKENLHKDKYAEKKFRYSKKEKSWDNVVYELQGHEAAVNEDMQTIKENGWLDFIDNSAFSKEELEYLTADDLSAEVLSVNKEVAVMSLNSDVATISTGETTPSAIDVYNAEILPKSMYDSMNVGVQQSGDEVQLNALTGNAVIKATDLSLKGKNGLDLEITRINSTMNTGNRAPMLKETSATTTNSYKQFYYVVGYADITVKYKEALPDGSYKKHFGSEELIFKSRIYEGASTSLGHTYYMASSDAIDNDIKRIENGRMPLCMVDSIAEAEKIRQDALDGDYNRSFRFNSDSIIEYIHFEVVADEDVIVIKPQQKEADIGTSVASSYLITTYTDGTDRYITDWYDYTLTDRYFDIGTGWEFDFPYIEKLYTNTAGYEADYLHFGEEGIWRINDDGTLDGYYLNDLILTDGTSYKGQECEWVLTQKDGKKYYFGMFGELIAIEDRFGNNILFEYTYTKLYDLHNYPCLKKIVDSVGRIVTFNYTDPLCVVVTVTEPNDSTKNRVIKYNKTLTEDNRYLLTTVTDAENNVTEYTYDVFDTKISLAEKSLDKYYLDVSYYIINNIKKPSDMIIVFGYSRKTQNVGNDGLRTYPYVSRQNYKELVDTEMDRYKNAYIQDVVKDGIDYTGYPDYYSAEEIPDDVVIQVLSYESTRDSETIFIRKELQRLSNDDWLCTAETVYSEDYNTNECIYRERTEYSYNQKNQIINTVIKKYNDPLNWSGIQSKEITYTYDDGGYNDLLKIVDGDENHSVSYEYDDTYHLPVKKTYKQNADTTIIERNTLTEDKKAVASTVVTENNLTRRKSEFTYDSYGNVTAEKRYTGNDNWNEYTDIRYSYADLSDRTNKLNDAFLGKISVSGIKDVDGNLVNSTGNIEYTYLYDWYGNVISETDSNGNVYSYTYDKTDRPTQMVNPDMGTIGIAYTYGCENNTVNITDENGNVTRYLYYPMGELKSVTDVTADKKLNEIAYEFEQERGMTIVRTTNYSEAGNTTVTDEIIDGRGNPLNVIVKDTSDNILYKESYSYEYAVDGLYDIVTKIIEGETETGNVTIKEYYDIYSNLVKRETVYMDGAEEKTLTEEYTYDYLGNVLTEKTPNATEGGFISNTYTYDIDGQVKSVTDALGNKVTYEYDGMGRLTRSADAVSNAAATPYYTIYTYDLLGRLLQEEIPFENNTYAKNKYYYDNNGNVIKTMSKNSTEETYSTTETVYNWRNAPIKVLTDGTDTAYQYDSKGNVMKMFVSELSDFSVDSTGSISGNADYEVTSYAYDTQGRVISETDALNKTQTHSYDINGNLLSTTDRNGAVTSYVYDNFGRLTSKTAVLDGESELNTYTYNKLGMMTAMTGSGVDSAYEYDSLGRLTKETLTNGVVKEYTYDNEGNRKSFKLTNNDAVQMQLEYDYDRANRLTTVASGDNLMSYTYDANGRITSAVNDDFTTSYSYNYAGLVTGLTTQNGENTIQNHTYQYYPNGNMSSKSSTVGNSTTQYSYLYDNAGRLVQEQSGANTTSYTYDTFSNRATMTSGNVVQAYTYDLNNRLTKRTLTEQNTLSEETNYYYDDNGNCTTKQHLTYSNGGEGGISLVGLGDSTITRYTYNLNNLLVGYRSGDTTASYTYDGNNLRQTKTVNGVTTSHIWDDMNMVMETTPTETNLYFRGADGIAFASLNGAISYYQKDAHGDVTALADSTGTITTSYLYDAFGNQINPQSADINPFRYCGEYFDKETNLIYLRNRYYEPRTGRFITEDPIKDGLNWYAYCGNNPITFIDPIGEYYIKDNKNGTYTLVKEHWGFGILKAGFSVAVSEALVGKVQEFFGIVGGNSQIIGDVFAEGSNNQIIMQLPITAPVFKAIDYINGISQFASSMDVADMDIIAFGLMDKVDISTTRNNKAELDNIIKATYLFIESSSYFTETVGGPLGNETLHKIDYNLSQSKNPRKQIDKYYSKMWQYYTNMGVPYKRAISIAGDLKDELEKYDERRKEIFELYDSYMDFCIGGER